LSNNSTTDSSSLGTLFSELSTDLSTLVRQEIELARTETTEKVSTAARSAGALVAGGLIAYAGVIVVLIAVAILLGEIMPLWLAMLIVGLVVLVIGAIMAISGKNKLANLNVVPEKTVETLKEDARWAKEQVS
jgi:VIT1/CCC1 family predicted Fe2+/Mn2+ transporter